MRSIREFFHLGGEKFDFWRGNEDHAQFELTGLRDRDKREIKFEPDADVQEGDLVTFQTSGKRVSITEVDIVNGRGGVPFALVAKYRPEGERNPQPPQTSNTFHNYGSNYGPQGSGQTIRQEFTFRTRISLAELERLIRERGGDDTPELLELAGEIRDTIEGGESIGPERFGKWKELMERHAPWLLGPTAGIISNHVFGQITGR